MASYYEMKKTKRFLAGYVCSKCKSINLTEGVLIVIGRSPFKKNAERAADVALEKAMKALNGIREKPYRVLSVVEDKNEGGFNSLGGSYIELMEKPCPCCGHTEQWQASDSVPLNSMKNYYDNAIGRFVLPSVPQESRPEILESVEALDAWKTKTLAKYLLEYKKHWEEEPQKAMQIRCDLNALSVKNYDLEEEKNAIGGELKQLQKQLSEKNQEAKSYSMFSKERKEVNAQIKALDKAILAQRSADNDRRILLARQIEANEKAKQEILYENPGVLGSLRTCNPEGGSLRIAFRLD